MFLQRGQVTGGGGNRRFSRLGRTTDRALPKATSPTTPFLTRGVCARPSVCLGARALGPRAKGSFFHRERGRRRQVARLDSACPAGGDSGRALACPRSARPVGRSSTFFPHAARAGRGRFVERAGVAARPVPREGGSEAPTRRHFFLLAAQRSTQLIPVSRPDASRYPPVILPVWLPRRWPAPAPAPGSIWSTGCGDAGTRRLSIR